jgi:hypothetical protein
MKRMPSSEVRRRWFQVLDRVAAGEVIGVERNGRLVVLKRADEDAAQPVPDYRAIIRIPKSADADRWSWDWTPDRGLRPKTRKG